MPTEPDPVELGRREAERLGLTMQSFVSNGMTLYCWHGKPPQAFMDYCTDDDHPITETAESPLELEGRTGRAVLAFRTACGYDELAKAENDAYDEIFGLVPQADDDSGKPLSVAGKIAILANMHYDLKADNTRLAAEVAELRAKKCPHDLAAEYMQSLPELIDDAPPERKDGQT